MEWQRILSYITGTVDEELWIRNEYLAAENRIFRSQIPGRVALDDSDRAILTQIGKRLGLKALRDLATIVKPETILAWHRKLIARNFDGSANRKPGRPRVSRQIEDLVVRVAHPSRKPIPALTWWCATPCSVRSPNPPPRASKKAGGSCLARA